MCGCETENHRLTWPKRSESHSAEVTVGFSRCCLTIVKELKARTKWAQKSVLLWAENTKPTNAEKLVGGFYLRGGQAQWVGSWEGLSTKEALAQQLADAGPQDWSQVSPIPYPLYLNKVQPTLVGR